MQDIHGPGTAPHRAELPFDGIDGLNFAAQFVRFIAEASQKLIEFIAQTRDGSRTIALEVTSEAASRRARSGQGPAHSWSCGTRA